MNMANLKGSKTETNLMAAFAGESQARNKYTYFANKAKNEGYEEIAKIFQETAGNEEQHAKIWYKLLNDGIHGTEDNLQTAANGENWEWTEMYATMANEAREEGFNEIAALFEGVAKIEKNHEDRFLALLNNMKSNQVFTKPESSTWRCLNCGHIHQGNTAPKVCPVCSHPQAYFEVVTKEY